MNVFLYVLLKLFVAVLFFSAARVISIWVLKFVPDGKWRRLLLRPVGDSARRRESSSRGGKLG